MGRYRRLIHNAAPDHLRIERREEMIHQKTTQNAISAVSRLAESYSKDKTSLASSKEIAESRGLPVPLVGKILTELSRGGLVVGSPGPGGGYRLAKPPSKISLKDVVVMFERETKEPCPFGPGWCGIKEPCPLHESLSAMKREFDAYLNKTTFAAFEDRKPSVPIKKRKRKRN